MTSPIPGATSTYSASLDRDYFRDRRLRKKAAWSVPRAILSRSLSSPNRLPARSLPWSPSIDLGQSLTLVVLIPARYVPWNAYQWFTGASCTLPVPGANSSTFSVSSVGTYYVQVTDSANTPVSDCSSGHVVIVNPVLDVGATTPSSPSIDGGQFIALTANASGGSAPGRLPVVCVVRLFNRPCVGATGSTYLASSAGTYRPGDRLCQHARFRVFAGRYGHGQRCPHVGSQHALQPVDR